MKTVRSALWPLIEKARHCVTPEFEAQLRAELSPLQPHVVAHTLQLWRPLAMEMARTSKTRERQALIDKYAPDKAHWALYAHVAWMARTIALLENLERADLEIQPKKWAANAALDCVDEFENDQVWLWPFDSNSPWPDADEFEPE